MASLEELLAKEGFKERSKKSRQRHRTSLGQKAVSMPLDLYRERNSVSSPPEVRIRTQRTKSDVSQLGAGRNRRPATDALQFKSLKVEDKNDAQEIEDGGERDSYDAPEDENYENLKLISRYEVRNNTEFQEKSRFNDDDHNKSISHSLLNELQEIETVKDKYCHDLKVNEITEDLTEEGGNGVRSAKQRLEKMSFGKNPQIKKLQSYKSIGVLKRNQTLERMESEPAIDEIAIQSMILIVSVYVKRFLKDGNFRTSVRRSCMSCLSFPNSKELKHAENGVVVNFIQAIETIERFAEEIGDPKELKRACLQLSVIAGFNSNDLKDGFTSGIPNSDLAACAHLYLSVIYNLQRKDRVSAKHLLQVFCASPFQARKSLLPELWNQLFLPRLLHLRVWYDQEVQAIPNTSTRLKKMELLERVYNEILDSGTYQFAVYYKERLAEGIEGPTFPSIHVPTRSVCGTSQDSYEPSQETEPVPVGSIVSQPMISKRLYESVFGHSNKLDSPGEVNDEEWGEHFTTSARDLHGSVEHDSTATHFSEGGTYIEQLHMCSLEDAPLPVTAEGLFLTPENARRSHPMAIEEMKELKEGIVTQCRQNSSENKAILNLLSHTKANELALKKLAKSAFHLQEVGDSPDSIATTPLMYSEGMTKPNLCNNCNIRSCVNCEFKKNVLASTATNAELPVTSSSAAQLSNYRYSEGSSFVSSIPKDFICPLTGQLFDDPVTLETGLTFERVAIKEWLDRGNKTCPVTGKTLQCIMVPFTNLVLKRVIDGWKSKHCKNLSVLATQVAGSSYNHEYGSKDEAAISILEQLLTSFNTEETMENAKHLISLGGLQFLVRRFEFGSLEEKTCVAMLLSCCIMADGGCRNYIARNIEKPSLVELLHSRQTNSRKNGVLLLTELICLNRRTEITSLLSSFHNDGIMDTLHVLLVYLQSCPLEQRPVVAVLLLHFDLMAEPRKYSVYREEAVDAIIIALECSATNEKVREQSCRSLYILGGHFSYSGDTLTAAWLLKEAGFCDGSEANSFNNDDEEMPTEEEGKASEEWWRNLTVLLLVNGKKSFLECISKCLGSGDTNLVMACLTTVAWLSYSLASMSDAELQLSAFSILIPMLKKNLEQGEIEHRVLASLSLFNFSKVSECRALLVTFAGKIMAPLHSLTEFTWTAEQLLSDISS
ncbi:hypothetical protein AAC387_Pa01g0243 [Persea americana]